MTPGRERAGETASTTPHGTRRYSYCNAGKDGGKIRTTTDERDEDQLQLRQRRTLSYAKKEKGTTLNPSWQYCYDLAGNLASRGVDPGCPRGTTYTVNDAQQITAKNGVTTNWAYDKAGNETAGASTPTAPAPASHGRTTRR